MTTVSQEAVEVTQADREAVAEFHRQSFKTLFTTTDADIDAGINRSYELLCQAFARHRQSAERGEVVAWLYEKNGKVLLDHGPTCSDDMVSGGWAASPLYTLPTPPEAV